MSERKMLVVDEEDATFIVKNAPEYIEGLVTSATLERWRKALRALTPKPDGGEAIEAPWGIEHVRVEHDSTGEIVLGVALEVIVERDTLRAEVQRLRDELFEAAGIYLGERDHARAEIARLRAALTELMGYRNVHDPDRTGVACGCSECFAWKDAERALGEDRK